MQQLCEYASDLSKRQIEVREDAFAGAHLATVNIAPNGSSPHLIRYQPAQRQYRDHFVAHELGHLIRFYSAEPEDQVVPTSNIEHRRRVADELQDRLLWLNAQGVPEQALGELLTQWHSGAVSQLTNYPADMRVERWLYETVQGLREPQQESLLQQLKDNEKVLGREVRAFTPPKLYKASATIDAAFAGYVARLYGDVHLARRYIRSQYWNEGRELARDVWESKDEGYAGDVATTREWATRFSLDGWFEWKHIDTVWPAEAT